MGLGHTTVHRGTRVRVYLKNGQVVDDRFMNRVGRWIVLETFGKVAVEDLKLKCVIPIKGVPGETHQHAQHEPVQRARPTSRERSRRGNERKKANRHKG